MTKLWVPELLSPAGNLEKLKLAVNYGANAVYLGGQHYGLRSAADNFTLDEISEGVHYAHERGVRVFVVLNSFLHDEDFANLAEFIEFLDQQHVDAVIVSDIGVVSWVQQLSKMEIHLSTQASCLNSAAAKFWKEQGVKRIVLGREVSLEDAAKIKKESGLEVELFVHGSMCMAYSGNCVISNFTQGRDSNRGGCAHSCRFEYSLYTKHNEKNREFSFFMSSKDLQGLALLERYRELGVDSLKIEGRMKSYLHVVTLTKVYAQALRLLETQHSIPPNILEQLLQESAKISHRSYCQGSLLQPAGVESIHNEREAEDVEFQLVGEVVESGDQHIVVAVRSAFSPGDCLEVISQQHDIIQLPVRKMTNFYGEEVLRSRPGSLIFLPPHSKVSKQDIIRMFVGEKRGDHA